MPQIIAFLDAFMGNQYMLKMGPRKIVATPENMSGGRNFNRIIDLWLSLSPSDKDAVIRTIRDEKGFTLGVYIAAQYGLPNSNNTPNNFIVYAKEYLDKLAEAANTSPRVILNIIATRSEKTQIEEDIIQVAFGDEEMYGNAMRLSPTGRELKDRYLSLL